MEAIYGRAALAIIGSGSQLCTFTKHAVSWRQTEDNLQECPGAV